MPNKWIDYEIENIENKGSTIAYFNELFAFEGKLEANNEISFIIKYNPISQMTEDEDVIMDKSYKKPLLLITFGVIL